MAKKYADTIPGAHYGQPYIYRRRFLAGLSDRRVGVKQFGFHTLRRYVASFLADTLKISSKTIHRMLRHKNVVTTEKSIHNLNTDLKAIMKLLSEEKGHAKGHEKISGYTGDSQ